MAAAKVLMELERELAEAAVRRRPDENPEDKAVHRQPFGQAEGGEHAESRAQCHQDGLRQAGRLWAAIS